MYDALQVGCWTIYTLVINLLTMTLDSIYYSLIHPTPYAGPIFDYQFFLHLIMGQIETYTFMLHKIIKIEIFFFNSKKLT